MGLWGTALSTGPIITSRAPNRNTNANEAYVESFRECLAAHVYLYLREVHLYMRHCLQVIVRDWFLPEQAMEVYDSK